MSRVTLLDIAKNSGVSKATVSLALRNNPESSTQTRTKIKKLAQSMGYRPDPSLSKIAASRWKGTHSTDRPALAFVASLHPDHLGLLPEEALLHPTPYILEDNPPDWVVYLSGYEHFRGAHQRADQLGYTITYHLYKKGDNLKSLCHSLYHRGVQGIMVSPIFERKFIDEFEWKYFACVSVADHYYIPSTDLVVPKLSLHMSIF
jgi:LacI family transcriptional regulator